jgi:hypothetical protein
LDVGLLEIKFARDFFSRKYGDISRLSPKPQPNPLGVFSCFLRSTAIFHRKPTLKAALPASVAAALFENGEV